MFSVIVALLVVPAWGQQTGFPYGTRTKAYSGYSTANRGDIRTVGMAGATVGLADTFISAAENPAGLAMTLGTGDFNYTSNEIHDDYIQDFGSPLKTSNLGVALNTYPWGFSAGYVQPYREGQKYVLPAVADDTALLAITTRELKLAAGRLFLDNRLALGLSLNFGQAEEELELTRTGSLSTANHAYSVGATLGAMLQIPRNFLVGAALHTPMHYGVDAPVGGTPALPGFFQNVDVPWRIGLGTGWIPNRFFRADATLMVVGRTPGAALVRDQTVRVGDNITFQPRLGAAYTFADFKDFTGTVFLGTYFEVTRVLVSSDRVHATAGIEAKPWVFTAGWGIDEAPGFRNYLVSLGVDVFKVMERLDLIPRPWRPARGGWFPRPTVRSDEGLPRPLVEDWKQRGPEIDPLKIGRELPGKLQDRVRNMPGTIKDLGTDMLDTIKSIPEALTPRKKK